MLQKHKLGCLLIFKQNTYCITTEPRDTKTLEFEKHTEIMQRKRMESQLEMKELEYAMQENFQRKLLIIFFHSLRKLLKN